MFHVFMSPARPAIVKVMIIKRRFWVLAWTRSLIIVVRIKYYKGAVKGLQKSMVEKFFCAN